MAARGTIYEDAKIKCHVCHIGEDTRSHGQVHIGARHMYRGMPMMHAAASRARQEVALPLSTRLVPTARWHVGVQTHGRSSSSSRAQQLSKRLHAYLPPFFSWWLRSWICGDEDTHTHIAQTVRRMGSAVQCRWGRERAAAASKQAVV